jgi:hypothetical protein
MARIADTYIRLRLDATEELEKEVMGFSYQRGIMTYFLGHLIRKVGQNIGRFVKSPAGRALGGMLKRVAKQTLTTVGHTLTRIGGPIGRSLGEKLVEAAGKLFGL